MNYHLKSSFKKKNGSNYVKIATAIFIIVVLLRIIFPGLITSSFLFIAKPLWDSNNFISVKLKHITSYIRFKESLVDENTQLKMQLAESENRLIGLSIVEKEKNDLLYAIGRTEILDGVVAFVLSRPPQSPYDSIIIDVGNDSLVKLGDNVIVDGTIWLGEIADIFGATSNVTLLSSPKEKLDLVVARTDTPITLSGVGGGNFQGQLPRGVDIKEGDIVVPPGLTSLVVARVSAVELNPEDSFQKIYANVPVNINNIQSVTVVKRDNFKINLKSVDSSKKSTTTVDVKKTSVKK